MNTAQTETNVAAETCLIEAFGERKGRYLLWNATCFPFDPDETLRQARLLADAKTSGQLDQAMRSRPMRKRERVRLARACRRVGIEPPAWPNAWVAQWSDQVWVWADSRRLVHGHGKHARYVPLFFWGRGWADRLAKAVKLELTVGLPASGGRESYLR